MRSRPINVRTITLCIITVILVLFALRAAAAFFIPLLLSLFLNYALAPVVTRIARLGVPRPIGAAIVVALVATLVAGAFYRVGNDFTVVLEQLPSAVQRVRLTLTETQRQHTGALEHVQRAATELEKLANAAAPPPPPASPALRTPVTVPATEKAIDLRSMLLVGTSSVFFALGQLMSVMFLTYFLLAAGDLFRRKLVSAVGPSLALRKTTLRILEDIDRLNQHYFAVVLLINAAVGTATGLGLYLLDMDQPIVWGIAAAILHTIPYLGSAVVAGAAALTAYGPVRDAAVRDAGRRRAVARSGHLRCRSSNLADGTCCTHERAGRVHRAAVLGNDLGRMGSAARGAGHGRDQDRL